MRQIAEDCFGRDQQHGPPEHPDCDQQVRLPGTAGGAGAGRDRGAPYRRSASVTRITAHSGSSACTNAWGRLPRSWRCPIPGPSGDSEAARQWRAARGWFPRSSPIDRRGRRPPFPLQPRDEYVADLPHGLHASHENTGRGVASPPAPACTASRPTPARLDPMPRLTGFDHWFALATPSRLACRTQAVWQYRPVPSLSGLLSPTACASRTRLPPASATRCDGPQSDISSARSFDAS